MVLILMLTSLFTFFMCFSYSPLNPSLKVTFSVIGPENQYDIQNNNLRKRSENTQNSTFGFVAIRVFLSI